MTHFLLNNEVDLYQINVNVFPWEAYVARLTKELSRHQLRTNENSAK